MTSPAAARGQDVRRRLLAAAVELIPERGWSAVSTRVLAERAGVTPSVVHYHFPSLPALLREAAIGVLRQAFDQIGAACETAPTPTAAVDTLLAAVDPYSATDPLSLLGIETYLAATRDEELRDQLIGVVRGVTGRIETVFRAHQVPAPAATAAVLAATVEGVLLYRGLDALPDMGEVADVLHRLLD